MNTSPAILNTETVKAQQQELRRLEQENGKLRAALSQALSPRFKVGDTVRAVGGMDPRKVVGMFIRYRVETSGHYHGWVCLDEDALEAFPVKTKGPKT